MKQKKQYRISKHVNNLEDRKLKETEHGEEFWNLFTDVVNPRIPVGHEVERSTGLCWMGPKLRRYKRILLNPLRTNITSNLIDEENQRRKCIILLNIMRFEVDYRWNIRYSTRNFGDEWDFTTTVLSVFNYDLDIIDKVIRMQILNRTVKWEMPMVVLNVCEVDGCDNDAKHHNTRKTGVLEFKNECHGCWDSHDYGKIAS